MIDSHKRLLAVPLAAGLCLTQLIGCAGPSTRVIPMEKKLTSYEIPEDGFVLEEVNPFYLQEELEILAQYPRPCGSRGEFSAARYLEQLLSDYGYQVERQRFRYELEGGTVTGTNVTAVRKAASADADILVICAHHDTVKGSPGAHDAASGVVAMLETARLLSRMPTDTEIRFVSFSGSQYDNLGSRHYVNSLSRRETQRMIGVIDLDQAGSVSASPICLKTVDGSPTMLGELISHEVRNLSQRDWRYRQEGATDGTSFFRGQVPAVTISQEYKSFEDGTPFDGTETVDIDQVALVVQAVSRVASEIMSSETPSMTAKAHSYNNLSDYAFVQKTEGIPEFGQSLEQISAQTGLNGILISEQTERSGRTLEHYQFRMKWLGVDQTIVSNYYFVDGALECIELDADKAGIELEEIKERLKDSFGGGQELEETPYGVTYLWLDSIFGRKFALIPHADGYTVEIREYSPERTVLYQGDPDKENLSDYRIVMFANLVRKMFPEPLRENMEKLVLYTDGVGHERGQVLLSEQGFILELDYADAITRQGMWRNYPETVHLLLGLYARLLELSGHMEYRTLFGERFEQEPLPEDEKTVLVGVAPGEAAQKELPPLNFEDSFRFFVLIAEPEDGESEWHDRVRFFYQFEELVQYRRQVRDSLRLYEEAVYAGEN